MVQGGGALHPYERPGLSFHLPALPGPTLWNELVDGRNLSFLLNKIKLEREIQWKRERGDRNFFEEPNKIWSLECT